MTQNALNAFRDTIVGLIDEMIHQIRKEGPGPILAPLAEVEKRHIEFVISKTRTMREAALVLKINHSTLWRKRKFYKIK